MWYCQQEFRNLMILKKNKQEFWLLLIKSIINKKSVFNVITPTFFTNMVATVIGDNSKIKRKISLKKITAVTISKSVYYLILGESIFITRSWWIWLFISIWKWKRNHHSVLSVKWFYFLENNIAIIMKKIHWLYILKMIKNYSIF